MKYIPGPWTKNPVKYHDSDTGKPVGEEWWVLGPNDEEIACISDDEATASLVAAAPDLLAALENITSLNIADITYNDMKICRAAIAKAKTLN